MGSELTAQKYRFVDAIRSSFTSGLNGCPQNLSGCQRSCKNEYMFRAMSEATFVHKSLLERWGGKETVKRPIERQMHWSYQGRIF